ncbi:MAG: hypothetical protein ACR2HF_00685 [Methylococcaceae bacterium]
MSMVEVVGDVQALHVQSHKAGTLFQVASQFNLLEMVSPQVTPESGVGIYQHDKTQGPACAIAAGAGAIYRNYFVPLAGQTGQSKTLQIDCLADMGRALGNTDERLWRMQNGYALATVEGLNEITGRLNRASEAERDILRSLLRIGIQWNTLVTLESCTHLVSQVYCSALPVAYSHYHPDKWAAFAVLVLEAAYEATLLLAQLNAQHTGNHQVYLTLLGGGAFGNKTEWILSAIDRALNLHKHGALDVLLVSRHTANPCLIPLLDRFNSTHQGIQP